MKKETTIAIIFGIIFGGLLAVVIISKNKENQLEKTKTITSTNKISPAISTSKTNIQQLEISEPYDSMITKNSSIKIKGKAEKNSLIIIQSPIKELIITNTELTFSVNFPLALGENIILINVYPKDKQLKSQEKEIKVYYLDEQI